MGALITTALLALSLGAGPNPFVTQAKDLYGKMEFEKCLKRINQAQQWHSTPKELLEIEIYAGLCHFNLGQKPDAEERFKQALRIDSTADLPPYSSPRAVEFFWKVKKSMKPAPQPMPDADLPGDEPRKEARTEPPPEPKKEPRVEAPPPEPKKEARVEAPPPEPVKPHADERDSDVPTEKDLVPRPREANAVEVTAEPGFGQKHAAAISLSSVAVVSLGVGIGLGAGAKGAEAQARGSTFESDYLKYRTTAQGEAIAANLLVGVAASAAVVAIVLWITGN